MKTISRIIALALVALMAMLCVGCNGGEGADPPPAATTPAATTPAATTPADTTPADTTEEVLPIRATDIVLSKSDASYRIVYKVGLKCY